MIKYIRLLLTVSAGVFTYLFGELTPLFTALISVVCIDYVTGIISAAVNHKLNSEKGFAGILKKVFIFLIVAVASILDAIIPATHAAIHASVCMFYIANESLSIIENAGEIGLPLPQVLKNTVEKLKHK